MFGLTGAHRTGKTTIAKLYAEKYGLPFVVLPRVIEQMGLTPADIDTFELRMKVQWAILTEAENLYKQHAGLFVTDRTPLDMAAYALADVRQDMTQEQIDEVNNYVTQCYRVANAHFSQYLLFQPGIPYVMEPGKPEPNSAYQCLIDTIITGLVSSERSYPRHFILGKVNTTIDSRMMIMDSVHELMVNTIMQSVSGMTKQ